ncbi:MAG: hypothetical protein GXO42_02505 [bacterium]|nr:hypothetical protein [bacterium]
MKWFVFLLAAIVLLPVAFASCNSSKMFCPAEHEQPNFSTLFHYRPTKHESCWQLLAAGVVLGLLDGIINPCVLSLIIILLSFLGILGSRKRALKCGIAFVVGAAGAYAFYVFLVLVALQELLYLYKIYVIISLSIILLVLGLLELKEYFWPEKGPRLALPGWIKPKLEQLARRASLFSAALLGAISSLVNLGCTGGFPAAYANMLAQTNYSLPVKALFILWYDLWFALPLVGIVVACYYGMLAVEKLEKFYKSGRSYMRLAAGVALLALGCYFLAIAAATRTPARLQAPMIIFYLPTCPHCHELLHTLQELHVPKKLYCLVCVDTPSGYRLWEKICKQMNSSPLAVPTVYVSWDHVHLLFVGYTEQLTAAQCFAYGLVPARLLNCSTCYDARWHYYVLTKQLLEQLCRRLEHG